MTRKNSLISISLFFIFRWTTYLIPQNQLLYILVSNTIFMCILIFINLKYLKKCFKDFKFKYIWYIVIGFISYFIILAFVLYGFSIFGYVADSSANQLEVEALFHKIPYTMSFMTIVQAPIIEEFVFRGALIFLITSNRQKKNKYLVYLACFMSATVFAFMHMISEVAGNLSFLGLLCMAAPYIVVSSVLVWLFVKTKYNILVPMLFHVINNTTSVIFILSSMMVAFIK